MQAAQNLLRAAEAQGLTIAAAESCTGGLLAACLTEIPGASAVFERGFVTYSNAAKTQMLGVPAALIATEGAVSEAVALAMAQCTLAQTAVDLTVAITGVAGPGGGSVEKPVGLVHLAAARRAGALAHRPEAERVHQRALFGPISRGEIRERSVAAGLALLQGLL